MLKNRAAGLCGPITFVTQDWHSKSTGLSTSGCVGSCNTTKSHARCIFKRPSCVLFHFWLAWYNRKGCLGVKHQVTYLLTHFWATFQGLGLTPWSILLCRNYSERYLNMMFLGAAQKVRLILYTMHTQSQLSCETYNYCRITSDHADHHGSPITQQCPHRLAALVTAKQAASDQALSSSLLP